ncbi:TRAP transporter small permease [Natronobeatus ordinarius]|uniref:TRAP transporter small permease n=1 Tax=Natronobeatus ordinarius TaxID=2963433 RepID=UPI0020CD8395|nr:TRAP transporter small permease [Natronobeatus ordinarius]
MALTDKGKSALDSLREGFLFVISNGNRQIAVASIALILLFTFINSVSRYLIQAPISGSVDIITFILMPLTIWFYAATLQYNEGRSYGDPTSEGTRREGNITVDFLANRLSRETNELIKLLYLPIMIGILGGLVYFSWNASLDAWHGQHWTTGAIQLPIWLPRFIITFGILFLVLELTRQFIHLLIRISRRASTKLTARV